MGGFRNLCLPKGDSFFDAYKKTFSNQRNFATRIYKSLQKNAVSILAKAPTQSGKTGSMIALTYEFLKHDAHSPSHVFVFTPHSSKEWLDQTCARFPAFFRDQIYHRNQLDSLVSRILPLQDVLIIVDECHIASKQHQAMHQLYEKLMLFDVQHLKTNRISLVHYTATPGGLEQQFNEFWGSYGDTLEMNVPKHYLSLETLNQSGRVLQAKDLCGFDPETNTTSSYALRNIEELLPFISNKPQAYHIIRTPRGKLHDIVISNFRKVFPNCVMISEPTLNVDINDILSVQPKHHTFLFIKEKLRCAKTIHHQFIGVLYERFVSNPWHHVVYQSLAGRLTGYHQNHHAVVFTQLNQNFYSIKHSFWNILSFFSIQQLAKQL